MHTDILSPKHLSSDQHGLQINVAAKAIGPREAEPEGPLGHHHKTRTAPNSTMA